MASQDKLGFMVFANATGLPNAAATPTWPAYVTRTGGAIAVQPARVNLGGGKFGVVAPVGDVAQGVAWVLDAGAGNHFGGTGSRYMSGGFFDDRAPFGSRTSSTRRRVPVGRRRPAFNAGEGWDDFTGALQPAPPLVAAAGAYLWTFTPSSTDLAEGRVSRLDAPAGASPAQWTHTFFGGAAGVGLEPDDAVAQLLAAIAPGPSLGTLAVDIFRGPVLPANPPIVPHQAIFCLANGQAQPDAYLAGGSNESFYRVGVQVRVRSAPKKYLVGQQLAVQVRNKLHLARLAGYVRCSADASHPLYMGPTTPSTTSGA
jgi:hypothetical protein